MGSCNFIFFLFYFACLWVKPCNSCNLSSKKTSCRIWRYKHQRISPFPRQCCTPGWKIRTSDISDLTSKTFCLAEGKYLSALKAALFRCWSEWWWVHSNMSLYGVFVLDPRHTQDTHGCFASWVFCQTDLRQVCDTWEPGLQWKWGHWASDLWQTGRMRTEQGVVNPGEDICLHFDKPECCLSVVLLWKTEICEPKDTWKVLIFLKIVFPTAKKVIWVVVYSQLTLTEILSES